MKKSRYSDEQIVRMSREADKDPVPEVAKRHGVSEQSIYGWRKRFAGMVVDDVKELKNLMQENVRLKKLLAERDLEIERKHSAKRQQQRYQPELFQINLVRKNRAGRGTFVRKFACPVHADASPRHPRQRV